tara:strand:+ start:86 stop:247 length:162 start_codon:yes stop_codon:yes gene_type:complete
MRLPRKKKSSRYQSLSRYNEGGLVSFKKNMDNDPRKTVVATGDKFNRYKTRIT